MENEKEKKIDKIGFIIILITIFLASIFIGANIKEPIWILQAIISIFTIVYITIKKTQKEKNVIIKGKIDIAVLLFMVATMVPYILKKYSSLEGTCNFILKYWSVYGVYILVRNIVNDKIKINILVINHNY